jgi:hypothetical protein
MVTVGSGPDGHERAPDHKVVTWERFMCPPEAQGRRQVILIAGGEPSAVDLSKKPVRVR